ncbi:hypothetical protein [Desmospora profundinema]|uniref:Uncharacterized protein n=1 Tax=Desmospora profundinema TaxID=1571184 RepID=A0ABU1IPV3_9BACL|nr:hypothetical protein [Desmospora profundinema]MDR6226820.1 hypothetical protein [Desmospora profundinema]
MSTMDCGRNIVKQDGGGDPIMDPFLLGGMVMFAGVAASGLQGFWHAWFPVVSFTGAQ